MTVTVVDELEVVQVDEQARELPPVRVARPISSSRRLRIARWFIDPVTASVPASARARTSARAAAAWSTIALASSTSACANAFASRRTSTTTASTSPRSDNGSSSAELISPLAESCGTLLASSSTSVARKLRPVAATQLTPGARSPDGSR